MTLEAAQNEASGVGPVVDLDGRQIRLRPKLPIGIASATQRQDFTKMLQILASGAEFVDPQPDDPDVFDYLEDHLYEDEFDRIAEAYGLTPGESSASTGS